MNCPYCGIKFSLEGVARDHSFPKFDGNVPWSGSSGSDSPTKQFSITSHKCPECNGQIMWLNEMESDDGNTRRQPEVSSRTLLYPRSARRPLPPGVPTTIALDFQEAHETLAISPKASAALSRRCVQNVIRELEGIRERDLSKEIEALLALNKLPGYLSVDLDAIRAVGNFAAHPIKDRETGTIVDVEPGEAEWTLEVLEELLKFYFEGEPARQARRDALNEKLRAAGKPPMNSP